ncbi:MAG: type III pantothenate kinase [Bacteroidota bacterium]
MQIAIDIGNSNVVVGIFNEDNWQHLWRVPTKVDHTALIMYESQLSDHLLESGINIDAIEQVIISSVVPDLNDIFLRLSPLLFRQKAILIRPEIYNHLPIIIDRPRELGTDLLANSLAATQIYKRDAIVVDFGTALTFTTVKANGDILGVAIAPGLKTAINALYSNTAQLPEVPLELPATPVGVNTTHAIQSGILIGYIGLVKHLLSETKREVGADYITIATGGLSSILHPLKDQFDQIDTELTLKGIKLVGDYMSLQENII